MGEHSGIQWTDHTWNPWQGCHHVSAGCANCYMFTEKRRYGQNPDVVIRSRPSTFHFPLRVRQPALIFTCSWSDWFIKEADPWRNEAWDVIRNCPHLTFQILTKRIERAAGRLPWGDGKPWPNVWGMVSVEDQETAERRIPLLLEANFALRGVSFEPALGHIDFTKWLVTQWPDCSAHCLADGKQGYSAARICTHRSVPPLDWIIVGGESMEPPDTARPCEISTIRSTVKQCREAKISCFVKQLGSKAVEQKDGKTWRMFTRDRKGGDIAEFPEDCRVRQFPVEMPDRALT